KPSFESFQVPADFEPPVPAGSRVILPSAVNVILYLRLPVAAAVNGVPVKKVSWVSLGAIAVAAGAAIAASIASSPAPPARKARMGGPPSDCAWRMIPQIAGESPCKAGHQVPGPGGRRLPHGRGSFLSLAHGAKLHLRPGSDDCMKRRDF